MIAQTKYRFKQILLIIALAFFVLAILNFSLLKYAISMGFGQLEIVYRSVPISTMMKDPNLNDSLKQQLIVLAQIRKFAIDSLGMKDSKNYTSFYDQKGKTIMWVVTASEKYRLKAYEWDFPFLGKVPYKGFFNRENAETEYNRLSELNYDADLGTTSAWSTLGFLNDPILSNMLQRKEGSLANLIIHELTHSTLFIKDSVLLNENLASFCGEMGALLFLKSKYGDESLELKNYEDKLKDEKILNDHIISGTQRLRKLYSEFSSTMPDSEKLIQKNKLIETIFSEINNLPFALEENKMRRREASKVNNAFFLEFDRYDSRKDEFKKEMNRKYNGNFQKYFVDLVRMHSKN